MDTLSRPSRPRREPSLKLCLHHVGGRDGSRGFPGIGAFEPDVVNVLYDADADCLGQVRGADPQSGETHVLPYCLGEACRTATFKINHDPFTSSLKDGNPRYGGYCFFNARHDYLLCEATRTVETRAVELVSLDHLIQSGLLSAPAPDFLSLDVEGAEYDILSGAKETLRAHVLALVVEVSFHERYRGQKLFGDVTALLAEQGFDFVKFSHLHPPFAPSRAPVGLRGDGFALSADAFYVRRLDRLEVEGLGGYVMARKLAFMAVVFHQFEYAWQCLARSRQLRPPEALPAPERAPRYWHFLKELEAAVARMPARFPRTFAELYSPEASRARFNRPAPPRRGARSGGCSARLKAIVRRSPGVFLWLRTIKRWMTMQRDARVTRFDWWKGPTKVEAVLIRAGLTLQAETLRANRLRHMRHCAP